MSLNFELSSITNYKTRCWVDVPEEQQRVHSGKRRLHDDTDMLIWGSLLVDLGSINVRNIEEWCFRVAILKRLDIRFAEMFNADDKVIGVWPSRDAIEDHCGLSTNVSTLTRAKWLTKIKKRIEKEAEQSCSFELKNREKENQQ